MIIKIILVLALSFVAGILYRLGGQDRKAFFAHHLTRDLGVSGVTTVALMLMFGLYPWWSYIVHFFALFVGLTTYDTWLARLAGAKTKFTAYQWFFDGWLHGMVALPLIFLGVHWWMILARAFLLGSLWIPAANIRNAVISEGLRGFLITSSTLLLLI